MFGKIIYLSDNIAEIENLAKGAITSDLMNIHVIFEAPGQKILGEITELNKDTIKIKFLGEYINGKYVNGVMRKPLLSSKIRVIYQDELMELVGTYNENSFILGKSATYKNFTIAPKINDIFSNHLAIFGNSGSGKSCGVARIIQNVFTNPKLLSYNANLIIFDAYGEYKNAFSKISAINENYNYKFITTNALEPRDIPLTIPTHLLNLDDFALLLQASKNSFMNVS